MFPLFTASRSPYSCVYQYLPTCNHNIGYPLIGETKKYVAKVNTAYRQLA